MFSFLYRWQAPRIHAVELFCNFFDSLILSFVNRLAPSPLESLLWYGILYDTTLNYNICILEHVYDPSTTLILKLFMTIRFNSL